MVRKLIHAVKGWIKGSAPKGRRTTMVYVYSPGKEASGGELNPNDQIAILRRLSTFTGKEDIAVTVIFPGRPTRKIPDGTKQGDVQACYATNDQLRKVVEQAVREAQKERSAVLATNNPDLEALARHIRIRHIRATTFEETLDTVCGPIRRDQPQQQPRRQPQQQPAPSSKPPAAQPEQQSEQAPEQAAISETNGGETPEAPSLPPPPKPEPNPRKLHRHEPSMKREERDQSILDLIDPL